MEYIISETKGETKVTVRMLQLKLLEIIKEIDRICKKNDIDYHLAGGSCLGAVRHKGFIPWDDDMDIAMSRENYKKFIKALDKDLDSKFVFHCYEKSKKYPVTWPAMKIRMKNTYIKELNKLLPNTCKDCDGIFIDVFIYDYMSGNKILDFPLRIINTLMMPIIILFENLGINPIPFKELYRFNARLYGKLCKNSKYFADEITWTFNPFTPFKYKYSDIYPTKKLKFENLKLPVPKNYDAYLKNAYGPNYMTPPPAEKRFAKHTYDINLKSDKPLKKDISYRIRASVYGILIGILLNIISIVLMNDISFILSGIGLIMIGIAFLLYIN